MRVSRRHRESSTCFGTNASTEQWSQTPTGAPTATKQCQQLVDQPMVASKASRAAGSRLSSRLQNSRGRPSSQSQNVYDPTSMETSGSPFLRLPPEVRVCIYRYLIPPSQARFKVYTDCNPIYTDRKWNVQRRSSYRRGQPNSLSLLRLNRIIYHEALSVLYSENTFHFIGCNFLPIIDFIRKLSPDAKGLVRRLKITMLPEARYLKTDQLELFCRVVHEWLPGLNVLASDAWVWI